MLLRTSNEHKFNVTGNLPQGGVNPFAWIFFKWKKFAFKDLSWLLQGANWAGSVILLRNVVLYVISSCMHVWMMHDGLWKSAWINGCRCFGGFETEFSIVSFKNREERSVVFDKFYHEPYRLPKYAFWQVRCRVINDWQPQVINHAQLQVLGSAGFWWGLRELWLLIWGTILHKR